MKLIQILIALRGVFGLLFCFIHGYRGVLVKEVEGAGNERNLFWVVHQDFCFGSDIKLTGYSF